VIAQDHSCCYIQMAAVAAVDDEGVAEAGREGFGGLGFGQWFHRHCYHFDCMTCCFLQLVIFDKLSMKVKILLTSLV